MAEQIAGGGQMAKSKKKKKKKKPLSADEKKKARIARTHTREVRSIFNIVGFTRVPQAANFEFSFEGTTSDFDDLFIYENVIVLAEYTTAQQSYISEHLKKKKVLYDKIDHNNEGLIELLDQKVVGFKSSRGTYFLPHHYNVIVCYCSLNPVKKALQDEVPRVKYLDFRAVNYFKFVTKAIRRSARFEFFDFLGLAHDEIGENVVAPQTSASTSYEGSILPEGHSNFGKGYKLISFYVDPEALLKRCYVLRRDRWEDKGNLYQRMISKSKIESIRRYLLQNKRVFINNIIVTLPSATKLLDASGNTQDPSKILKTAPVRIQLPSDYNSVGLIDGQHRVFSYYEGGMNEDEIRKLRTQQNLLVTGIIYPQGTNNLDKIKFEATLFLEINSTQTNAKSDLKQAIGVLLTPFAPESIAKEVVNQLNDDGPLADEFERYFFEKAKLKTTTVVSYGLRPIVKLQGDDTLFKVWPNEKKKDLVEEKDSALLEGYVKFCAKEINIFLSAMKACLPAERWTTDKKVAGRFLTPTNINGAIICLRKIIEHDKLHTFEYYRSKLVDLKKFDFTKYGSSQYNRMAQDLYEKYFT
jgi:DGQHR domain-containing protein